MAKQKIVVKVTMHNEKQTRKALQIAVSFCCGVESACFEGSDKDLIAVTGEGIDPVKLAKSLRKSVGSTEIVSVAPVNDKKPDAKATAVPLDVYPPPPLLNYGFPYRIHEVPSYNNPTCMIL